MKEKELCGCGCEWRGICDCGCPNFHKPEPKGWEERFDEIVSEWKEPEFRFERHEKLIDYTSDVIKKMRVLISHVEQEALERGRNEERERIINEAVRQLNLHLFDLENKDVERIYHKGIMHAIEVINSLNGNE